MSEKLNDVFQSDPTISLHTWRSLIKLVIILYEHFVNNNLNTDESIWPFLFYFHMNSTDLMSLTHSHQNTNPYQNRQHEMKIA